MYVNGEPEQLQVDNYVPGDPSSDTVALRARAVAIYAVIRPELDSSGLTTLTVRAINFADASPLHVD